MEESRSSELEQALKAIPNSTVETMTAVLCIDDSTGSERPQPPYSAAMRQLRG